MEQEFIDKLKTMVKEQGNGALTDIKRCKTLLGDYIGNDYAKESSLLLQAVEAGITLAIEGADELDLCKKAKIRDLEEDYGFSQESAEDIVNALALVLRGDTTRTASPVPEKEAETAATANAESAADARYKEATVSFTARRYNQAIPVFKELAAKGHAKAQRSLALCYDSGTGIMQDKTEAAGWFRRAAEKDDAIAQYKLGLYLEKGDGGVTQNDAQAVKWYRKAAEQGYAEAQNTLGAKYLKGVGVPPDKTEAVKWYRKAAEQEHVIAQYNLGLCYYEGEGVTPDKEEAIKWFRLAAEQGHDDAEEMIRSNSK